MLMLMYYYYYYYCFVQQSVFRVIAPNATQQHRNPPHIFHFISFYFERWSMQAMVLHAAAPVLDKPYTMLTQWSSSSSLRLVSILLFQFVRVVFSPIQGFISSRSPGDIENDKYVFVGRFVSASVKFKKKYTSRYTTLCLVRWSGQNDEQRVEKKKTKTFIWSNVLFIFVGPSVDMCACDRRTMTSQSIRSYRMMYFHLFSGIDRCIERHAFGGGETYITRENILTNDLLVTQLEYRQRYDREFFPRQRKCFSAVFSKDEATHTQCIRTVYRHSSHGLTVQRTRTRDQWNGWQLTLTRTDKI